ncbi:hypothetical protein, partial [Peptococcus simiae]
RRKNESSKCAECKPWHPNDIKDGDKSEPVMTCDAFPDGEGIPMEIFKATKSVPCSDHISFEPEDE